MINFLAEEFKTCGLNSSIQPVWTLVGIIINIIMIGVPILLIIFGMVDLGKAVIASKEEEVKKATKLLGKRFLYAVGVFAVVWIVTFLFDAVSSAMGSDNTEYKEYQWKYCWKCNIRNKGDQSACQSIADALNIPDAER